jgi:hypothetical protein
VPTRWLEQNWFTLLQSIGIIGSVLLTAWGLLRDRRQRRVGDLLTLAAQHRELWSDVHKRPELARVGAKQVDLVAQPISVAEEEFLLLVIVHFWLGWKLAKEGALLSLAVLAKDSQEFFTLPLPHDVWRRTKEGRDPKFVRFIEKSIARKKKLLGP